MSGHAVVVGASIAGLLAARVLADHADEVTLLERDRLPAGVEQRKGVPQARHVHIFLLRGQREVEPMLPGFGAALEAAGAPTIDLLADVKTLSVFGWFQRCPSDLHVRCASRELVEHLVRRLVLAHPRVRVVEATEAVGLVGDAGQVRGVQVRPRGEAAGTTGPTTGPTTGATSVATTVAADLVVDASGRESHLTQWLAAIGAPAVPETAVNAHLGYASRTFQAPASPPGDWRLLLVRNPRPSSMGGVLFPVEGDRWVVTLGGFGRDQPATDEAGFDRFAAGLTPEFAAALRSAEPLGHVAGYRRTANRWRHLERLPSWPRGLAVLGDAACTFNPIYGQGLSVATIEAAALRDKLGRHGLADAGDALRRRLARLVRDPWTLATGEDYRYPDTEGPRRSPAMRLQHWWSDQVLRAATRDPVVTRRFTEVVHLLAPPSSLAAPEVARRVVAARLRPS